MLRIVAEDTPTWKGMNPRAWMRKTDYPAWAFAPAYEAFTKHRTELLAVLDTLPPDGWERTAKVSGMLGETYHRSARYYGAWMAGHERAHWKHVGQIVAALRDEGAA